MKKIKIPENIKSFLLYVIVGGIATVAEWAVFYVLSFFVFYTAATAIAYIISTFVNWLVGRLLVFKKREKGTAFGEIVAVYSTSAVGLLLNLGIMFLLVNLCAVSAMLAKMLATGIVFFFNFAVRKFFIYK